ncbi:MAG: tetratricopeptide repeat protein, partial [Syntrophobacteraceae bacterium]
RDFTLGQRLLTEARVVVWYMSLLLWPVPSRLSMQHDPLLSTSLFSPLTTLPAILFIATLIFFAVKFRKRFPVITFGIIWFFLNLVIESTIIPLELVFEHRLYLPSVGFYMAVVAICVGLFRKAARQLPEIEFAKAACSILLLVVSLFTIFTFLRNTAWKNIFTIKYDSVLKAPENPRANADFANSLCEVKQYAQALKYGQKAIKISKKGRESYSLAENAIVLALMGENRTNDAIDNASQFMKERVHTGIDVGALPICCLNVARACLLEKKPEDAYNWALKALKYVRLPDDSSSHNKSLIQYILVKIFFNYSPGEVDPHLFRTPEFSSLHRALVTRAARADCTLDVDDATNGGPGACTNTASKSRAVQLQRAQIASAIVFKAHGEEQYALEILQSLGPKNSDDPFVKSEMAKIEQEKAQNLAQKKNWGVYDKYVHNPFSRFNFDLAVAYLVQKYHLPKFFQHMGENRIDAALKISPASRDARLLKAWYLYGLTDRAKAAKDAKKLLSDYPKDSNIWFALGFFRAGTGDDTGALEAFHKVLELYPDYPHRAIIEDVCMKLSKGRKIKSASLTK